MSALATEPIVAGYEIEGVIGVGASATVWAVRRRADGARLAAKIIAGGTPDADAASALTAICTASSPHLVPVHEVVQAARPPGAVALVMDRLDGGTVADLVSTRGRLTPGETVTVVAPIAQALDFLHAQAVVHGDVTPVNVVMDREGKPFLADLGLACVVGESRDETYGVAGFVAPEVVDGAPREAAADVYGLGAIAWYALTGDPPQRGPLRAPLEDFVSGVPEPMTAIITRCLALDPADRPDAYALATEIFGSAAPAPVRAIGGDPVTMLTHRLRHDAQVQQPAHLRWRHAPVEAAGRRRPGSALAAVAGLIALVLGVWAVVDLGRSQSTRATQAVVSSTTGLGNTRTSQPAQAPAVGAAPASASDDLQAALQALLEVRAEAWNRGDPARLAQIYTHGSAAGERDVANLDAALAAGTRFTGVDFAIDGVEVLSRAGTKAKVTGTIGTSAYRVLGSSPRRADVEAVRVTIDLSEGPSGWQIDRVVSSD